jgi:Mn2+/Fe2+ NRAMP family transporter
MAIILIPGVPLIRITIWTQVLNGILLPVVLICMMRMINNAEIMGEYTNKPLSNVIGWATVIALLGLTGYLLIIALMRLL